MYSVCNLKYACSNQIVCIMCVHGEDIKCRMCAWNMCGMQVCVCVFEIV
jgi:hypothetical protein